MTMLSLAAWHIDDVAAQITLNVTDLAIIT
jgi:hypothetical protein